MPWFGTRNRSLTNVGPGATQSQGTSFSTWVDIATPAATGTYPFSFAIPFAQGQALPNKIVTSAPNYQVKVTKQWRDGSVKHAVISGRAAVTQSTNSPANNNNKLRITISNGNTPTESSPLTASSIQTAAPTSTVDCGAFGSVSLSSQLASPFRTRLSGPEMVECHYKARVGSSLLLVIWVVRLFADNRMHITVNIDNGYLDNGSGGAGASVDRSFVPTVSIGGTNVFTNGGASLNTCKNCGWDAEGWIGGDPQLTCYHSVTQLTNSKQFPSFFGLTPTSQGLTQWFNEGTWVNFATSYTPMMQGDATADMGITGYQPQIGLLPLWNALVLTSGCDYQALRTSKINARAIRGRPIVFRKFSDDSIPKPSDFTGWTYAGNVGAGGGVDKLANTLGNSWEIHHAPAEAYMMYQLTGEWRYLDTLAMQAATYYLYLSASNGSGVNRTFRQGQVRGTAWGMRTVGLYCAIAPDDDNVVSDYRTWFNNGIDYWWSKTAGDGSASQLGYPYSVGYYDSGQPLAVAPWMYHFWIASMGFLYDVDPGLSDRTKEVAFRDFIYKAIVGILGGNGSSNYCYTDASNYNVTVATFNVGDFTPHYANEFLATWGDVWTATKGSANTSCGTTLQGTIGGDPAAAKTGYWGNLLPAIAYALDHGATNAIAAWNRLTSASNWATVINSGFNNTPTWGVAPRTQTVPGITPAWFSSVLPSVATWGEVPGSNMSAAQTYAAPLGRNKQGILAYSGACVIRVNGRIGIAVAGGGHTDYPGNEILVFWLDTATWEVMITPSADGNIQAGVRSYLDGRPNSRHTYWELHNTEHNNRLMFIGAGSIWENGGATGWVEGFDLVNKTYDAAGTYASIPGGLPHLPDVGQCKDSRGWIWHQLYSGGTLHKYVPTTDTWSSYGAPNLSNGLSIAHDSTRDRLVSFDNTDGHIFTNLTSSPTFSSATFTGAEASNISRTGHGVYSPALDAFLYKRFDSSVIYHIDAGTLAVTVYSLGGTPPTVQPNGFLQMYGRCGYVPEYKLYYHIGMNTSNIAFWRHA